MGRVEQAGLKDEMAGRAQKLEVISWLKSIADPVQFKQECSDANASTLNPFFCLIIDDIAFQDPSRERMMFMQIGPNEEKALKLLATTIIDLIECVGHNKPDVEYVQHSLWDGVLQSARASYSILTAPR